MTEMEPDGLNQSERTYLIEAIYRIVGQVERKFDALRETDLAATALWRAELTRRLEGFPQQYATTNELEQEVLALRNLEKGMLSRQVYEQNHQTLEDQVVKLDREKLAESVFNTFVDNYRIEVEKSAADRRNILDTLGMATNQVREQLLQERTEFLTVESYQLQHKALVNRVDGVQAWQYKLVGGLVFATFVAPLVTATVVWAIAKGF